MESAAAGVVSEKLGGAGGGWAGCSDRGRGGVKDSRIEATVRVAPC